jgi:tetratricopeptide (TPR) repeat protein
MSSFRLKLIGSLVLIALPLCAQAPLGAGLWPNSVPVFVNPSTDRPVAGQTVSVETLRCPVSASAVRMFKQALQKSDDGDHAGAAKRLERIIAKYPGMGAYVYGLLGDEYLKTHQMPEALDALEQAVKLSPQDAADHANLGLALLSNGQYDLAEAELHRALDLDPRSVMASRLLDMVALSKSARK